MTTKLKWILHYAPERGSMLDGNGNRVAYLAARMRKAITALRTLDHECTASMATIAELRAEVERLTRELDPKLQPDNGDDAVSGWVIEDPQSSPSAPRYLSYEGTGPVMAGGGGFAGRYREFVFAWRESHTFALRFARKEDAQQVENLARFYAPHLWEVKSDIGGARIAAHVWSAPQGESR